MVWKRASPVADAFSASGSSTSATSVYRVLDKAVSDGIQIGVDMLDKMGKRRWYEIGMLFWDVLNSLIIYAATLVITLAKGCCVVTGTAFDLPMILKIDPLLKEHRPSSDDMDLEILWTNPAKFDGN